MLREVTEAFKELVGDALHQAGMVLDYKHSAMFHDLVNFNEFDGGNVALLANKWRIPERKLMEALLSYTNLNPTPEEDVPAAEYTVGAEPTQTDIILNPSLEMGGSSMDAEHEIDPKQAIRNHLKKRIQARRYMQVSQALKASETDQTVDDEDLESCGIEPGLDHGAWQELLRKRRERIKDQNADNITSNPGSSGNDNVNGFAYSGAD
jgi:hypothetical protein